MKYGSIGCATIAEVAGPADLIPAFVATLESISPGHALAGEIKERMHSEGYYSAADGEVALSDLEKLFDTLDMMSAPFCYFGANNTDGADYGFWMSDDAVAQGIASGELVRVVGEWPTALPENCQYVLDGETLYTRNHEKVWSSSR